MDGGQTKTHLFTTCWNCSPWTIIMMLKHSIYSVSVLVFYCYVMNCHKCSILEQLHLLAQGSICQKHDWVLSSGYHKMK